MKKAMAWMTAIVLILGCVSAVASEGDELTEVRCDEWHFSVKIPTGMKAAAYDYEDPEYEKTTGGGLAVSSGEADGMPKLWILRRDHVFNNPYNYLRDYYWEHLSVPDEIYDDLGYSLSEHGGMTLRGSGRRFFGENDEILFVEYRFIPYRDDRGTEFVLRYTAENEETAYSLLETVIRNYVPDEELQQAKARYLPIPEEPNLQNGTYRVSFEDVDRIGPDGYCTAVLYTTDYFRPEDVRAMKPGDTLRINDRICTLTDIDDPEEGYEVGIMLKETAVEQSFWGMSFIPDESGERYFLYIMDDWNSVSRVGSIRIDASQTIEYYDVPGGDDPELLDADMLAHDYGVLTLTELYPYSTTCELKEGRLTRIYSASYPVGPADPFVRVPLE